MNARTDDELDRIFAEFHDDRRSATPRPLTLWIAEHPDLSAILTHWATEVPSITMNDGRAGSADFEARSLDIGKAVYARLRPGAARGPAFSTLNDAARTCGARPREIAAASGIGMTLFAKLNRRLIEAATVPDTLVDRLATGLRVTVEDIRAYLAQPPALADGAAYRSEKTPEAVGGQSFAEALRECTDMTDEQKQIWQ